MRIDQLHLGQFTLPSQHPRAGAPYPVYGYLIHHPVDGEAEVLPGIRVLPTPSHTVGHQAVIIESGRAREVIAGQAVHDRDELEAETSAEDLPTGATSSFHEVAKRIKSLRPNQVWFSHDRRVWEP